MQVSLGSLAVATVLLAGCDAAPQEAATESRAPTVSSAPSPTPTESADEGPGSRFEFACPDFTETIAELLGGDVQLDATVPETAGGPRWLGGPAQYAIPQLGGLVCEFGGAQDGSGSSATIFVVPDGAGAITARAEVYGDGEEPRCSPLLEDFSCTWVDLVAGSYAELRSSGIAVDDVDEAEARLDAAISGIRSYLVALPASDDRWAPPTETVAIAEGCGGILPPEALAGALGSPELAIGFPAGGWSIEAWTLVDEWDALPCYYYEVGVDPFTSSVGELTFLPGGAWAFVSAVRGTPVTLPGEDHAAVSCGTSEEWACTIDVLAGGSWLRWATDVEPDDPPEYAAAIAATIVAGVRG
ncbi:hypothetical protein GCM10022200_28280 [Microbacterium awajiense]|uniref:DUF3558 domain-containing protein n=1 Tax=Microbacterium awajiense TaxID=415214 RepID=A0ABP7AXA8_9MICO